MMKENDAKENLERSNPLSPVQTKMKLPPRVDRSINDISATLAMVYGRFV